MKILAFLLATATVVLAAVCFVQGHKLDNQKARITALQGDVEQGAQHLEELQALQQRSETQRRELRRQADELTAQLQAREAAESNLTAQAMAKNPPAATREKTGKGTGGFGKAITMMMQDPGTKKMIRDQQRVMLDQLYSPLIKQLGLSPEDADKFKDLLADNMMKGAEKASSMFGGGSATNRSEVFGSMAAEQKNLEEEVKTMLGDAGFAQYKDYQMTAGERMQLNAFKQQIAGGNTPLTDDQTEQLLAIMKEEKQTAAASTGQPPAGMGGDQANMETMLSDEQAEKLLQSQQSVSQRVYDRARAVLSPDQMDSFGRFQTNQLQMMRVGVSMARKMFAPDDTAEDAPPTDK